MPSGACHCGRVCITIPSTPAYLNECQCTLCFKYGVRWCYFTKDQVRLEITVDGKTTSYSLSDPAAAATTPLPGLDHYIRTDVHYKTVPTRTAFNRCDFCGGLAFWVWTVEEAANKPDARMGINSQLFLHKDLEGVEVRKTPGPP